jgi:hypothetical protein
MKNEKKKADQLKQELQREEKVPEGIRYSLKGMGSLCSPSIIRGITCKCTKGSRLTDCPEKDVLLRE